MGKLHSYISHSIDNSGDYSDSLKRRSRLLAWLLLFSFILTVAALVLVIIVNPENSLRRSRYTWLILFLITVIIGAWFANRSGHYYIASVLTIGFAFLGPWGSLLLDPVILQGDFVPLTYTSISVLLSSILLPLAVPIILAVVQFSGLVYISVVSNTQELINWPSLLAFFVFISALSIIVNFMTRRDVNQIDQQKRQLINVAAQLKEQTIRDPLTKLFNRRYMEVTLEHEIQRARNYQIPIGIIMMDIDRFKEFNDSKGHTAGDTLLKELGKFLLSQIRISDVICRYGGDEFVLILPGISEEDAYIQAEKIRMNVKKLHVEDTEQEQNNEQELRNITLSLGVAVFPQHSSDENEIVKLADNALYQAKEQGRDRVVSAGD
ncbi:MAG: diguanylate cyclase [Spirochaetia bacterium]|nr:diguanylate cyclase [Spirochaetia bacterium]